MSNSTVDKTYAFFETPHNKKLAVQLANNAVKFFLFPPLETEKIILDEERIALLKNINEFDWLIFTDVLSVDYFLETLTENEIDFFELDAVRVCAFGEAVADRLRFVQIHADLIPNSLTAETVFSNISVYVGENGLADLKFLLIKESSTDFEISELLKKKKIKLIELPIYKAKDFDKNKIARLKTLIKGGAIDEFIFSSPEDLIALKNYFPDDDLEKLFAEVKISAVDANTFQNLKENNFKRLERNVSRLQ
ncbi:hypothetical protein BH20ACI1_BH20ACI1_30930 [soil metagenome]